MSKRVLVTGGCGFLGSNLCKRLVAEGHSVMSLDDGSRGSRQVDGVEYIIGDVREEPGYSGELPSGLQVAIRNADTVFHLAAINGTRHFYERPEEVLDVQIRGTLNVLDACKANGVKELVLFSSSEVYGQADQIPTPETVPLKIADPFNPRFSYAAGKIAAEMMCLHARHLDRVLVIRPHNVYGPDMGFEHVIPELTMQAARRDGKYVVVKGHGNETRAFCHISDFIDGVMVAWAKAGSREIVHVGREQQYQIDGIGGSVLCQLRGTDRLESLNDVRHSGEPPPGEPVKRCPDASKLRSWGWDPKIDPRNGIPETIDWYLANRERWPK